MENFNKKEIGQRVAQSLAKIQKSQEEIGYLLSDTIGKDLDHSSIGRLLKGERLTLQTLVGVSKITGRSLDWLITGKEYDPVKASEALKNYDRPYTMRECCKMLVQLHGYTPYELTVDDKAEKAYIVFSSTGENNEEDTIGRTIVGFLHKVASKYFALPFKKDSKTGKRLYRPNDLKKLNRTINDEIGEIPNITAADILFIENAVKESTHK